jgi:hypothetical protein
MPKDVNAFSCNYIETPSPKFTQAHEGAAHAMCVSNSKARQLLMAHSGNTPVSLRLLGQRIKASMSAASFSPPYISFPIDGKSQASIADLISCNR